MNTGMTFESNHILSLIYCLVFLAAELFCIYINVKCFKFRELRREPYLIILFLTLHLTLIFSFLIHISSTPFCNNNKLQAIFGYLVILPKDIFILMFTLQILRFVIQWDDENKLPKIVRIIIQVVLCLHAVAYIALLAYGYDAIIDPLSDYTPLMLYLSLVLTFIAVLYVYSFVSAIRIWRNSVSEEKLHEYLKWLLITMLFMTLTLLLRIILNLGQYFTIQQRLKELTVVGYHFYMAFNYIGCNLVPCILMCICYHHMAKDYSSEYETNEINDSAEMPLD